MILNPFLFSSFVNALGQKVTKKKLNKKKLLGKKKVANLFLRKHNRVFPVFGKRSVDEHITHEEKFYLNHHRNSRFAMYEKIEGFLKG